MSIDKTIDQNVINNIDFIFKNSKQSQLIDKIYQRLSSEKIDRHNYFLNRLLIEKIQTMVSEEKNMEDAKKFSNYIFKQLFEIDSRSAKLLSNDLKGLLKFNFNLYDLYKLDHS